MEPVTSANAPRPGAGTPALTPVAAGERVALIDVLRGFAIFGILLVNLQFFFSPVAEQLLGETPFKAPIDRLAHGAIVFFAQAKFYSLFSFLFGMGLAIQMERALARGRRVAPFFARRMLWLLLIGLAHAFLLWFGDILITYALLGFVLILFRQCKDRTLLRWTVGLFAVPVLGYWTVAGMAALARQTPAGTAALESQLAAQMDGFRQATEAAYAAYPSGHWLEIFAVRAQEWLTVNAVAVVFAMPGILALFLVGLNLGRRRFFQRLPETLPAVRRWIVPLGVVGVLANVGVVMFLGRVNPAVPDLAATLQRTFLAIGGPALCFFYVCAITLLWQRAAVRHMLGYLAPVGRMALSNYLMHTVIFTTLAYGYGLGLYGEVSPSVGLAMTLAMYLLQIPLSAWWLRRYRFGPLEWLWRSLTYGRLQPMRR